MPDPTHATISATQSPALWNVSPWVTRWMLYKHFHDAMPIDAEENPRMSWGRKLQPLVLDQAAEDLKLEIRPHDETYVRRGLLGATRDAEVICPDRGPGAFEAKCVFDYRTWMSEWDGGGSIPRHYEIQLQQQMLVGDGETPYRWGALGAWVAGELHYFERQPIADLWENLEHEAERFFSDVREGREPDPFGAPVEAEFLAKLERDPEKVVERIGDDGLALAARELNRGKELASEMRRLEKVYRPKLLAAAGDAGVLKLSGGITVNLHRQERDGYQVKPTAFTKLDIFVPEEGSVPHEELPADDRPSVLGAG